jgi:hypothetical protein
MTSLYPSGNFAENFQPEYNVFEDGIKMGGHDILSETVPARPKISSVVSLDISAWSSQQVNFLENFHEFSENYLDVFDLLIISPENEFSWNRLSFRNFSTYILKTNLFCL